jgi:apolipoprotein N-acyltransferase
VATTLALAVLAYGAFRLQVAGATAAPEPVAVGIVQAHLPLGSQWRREFYGRNLAAYLERTDDILRRGDVRLVVWPENAMTFFLSEEPAYRAAIARVLRPFEADLVAGGPTAIPGAPPSYLNSAFHLAPDGEIRGRYDKRLLLPFAEYFPFRRFDFLRRSFGRVREFTPGERTPLLETGAGPAGVVICNEGFFPEPAAERVSDGARFLINLANDSWLADPKYSHPAFDMVALRAVEQRRWIVRASTAGPSALLDPFGRVLKRTELFSTAAIAGEIEPRDDRTLYARLGDAFAWGCVLATALGWIAAARRGRAASAPATGRSAPAAPPAAA